MTACNGFAMTVSEKRSFFSDLEYKFIPLTSDGEIECRQFLDASRGITTLFDHLGRAFAPVKYDIIGNIEKLEKIYVSDVEKFHTLQDMLQWDMANNPSNSQVAVEALLWLKRALEYVRCFLQFLVDDHTSGSKSENLLPFCLSAYERTLKPYHGWMVQKLCSLCMRSVPWRRDFIKMMAHGREGLDEIVILDMNEYLGEMNINVDAIVSMYNEWDLNSDMKV